MPLTQSTLRRWVRRHLGNIDHELRVAQIARKLFLLTRPLHELPHSECRLLILAALVHDVGRAVDDDRHAQVGARMILDNPGLRLTESERRRLASLTRHHRGHIPEPGEESHLDPQHDNPRTTRILMGLLRAADALDARGLPAPTLIISRQQRLLTLHIHTEVDLQAAQETFARPKKLKMLQQTLSCRIRTLWFCDRESALAT